MTKRSNMTIVLLFILFLGGFFVLNAVFSDKNFSPNENRFLQEFPHFSVDSLVSGRFTADAEVYASDQFAFRDQWISLKARTELLQGKSENNGVFLCQGDRLMKPFTAPDCAELDRRIAAVDTLRKNIDVPVSLALIPTASEIYSDLLPAGVPNASQEGLIEYIYSRTDANSANIIYNLLSNKEDYIFYRTDHHWTSLGAYWGYTALGQTLGYNPQPLSKYHPQTVSSDFFGTNYSFSGFFWMDQPDSISIFRDAPDGLRVARYDRSEATPGVLYDTEMLDTKDKYRFFLGDNSPRIVIDTGDDSLPSLLILRDSFADCLVPFLIDHYSSVHLLDLRYFTGSVAEYVREHGIDSVLVLYSTDTFCSEQSIFLMMQ